MKKTNILKHILVAAVVLGTVVAPTPSVFADSTSDTNDSKVATAESKEKSATDSLSSTKSEISSLQKRAETLLAQQQKSIQQQQTLAQQNKVLKDNIADRSDKLNEQARNIQESGDTSNYVDFIFNAASISDAVGRINVVSQIVGSNRQIVKEQKADQEQLASNKKEVDLQVKQQNAIAGQLEKMKGTLTDRQLQQEVLLAQASADKSTAEGERDQYLAQVAAAKAKQEADAVAAQAAATEAANKTQAAAATPAAVAPTTPAVTTPPASNNGGGSSSGNGSTGGGSNNSNTGSSNIDAYRSQLVSYAKAQMGKPYVWGAHGPNSFDCSGLMEYVYSNVTGKYIGAYTVPQETSGTRISVSQAQPGDLLFWGSAGSTHHVGMAIGGGQYIHAPEDNDVVKISTISSYFMPSFAVRVNL